MSGYPDGTWDGDRLAPWNEPEEDELCLDCRHCRENPECGCRFCLRYDDWISDDYTGADCERFARK